jgi:hypothetical protein
MAACSLSRGAAHDKDRSVVACSVLFGGLIAATCEVWAAKYHKGGKGTANAFAWIRYRASNACSGPHSGQHDHSSVYCA